MFQSFRRVFPKFLPTCIIFLMVKKLCFHRSAGWHFPVLYMSHICTQENHSERTWEDWWTFWGTCPYSGHLLPQISAQCYVMTDSEYHYGPWTGLWHSVFSSSIMASAPLTRQMDFQRYLSCIYLFAQKRFTVFHILTHTYQLLFLAFK